MVYQRKIKLEEAEGKLIYDLGNRQWDIPKLRELVEDIFSKNTSFDNFEVEHDFPDIPESSKEKLSQCIESPK